MKDKFFYQMLYDAFEGWKIWHRCIKKYQMKVDTAFVLAPSEDARINYYGLKYLDQFLKTNQMKEAVLVVTDRNKRKLNYALSDQICGITVVASRQMERILTYYYACNPDRRFVVMDIDSIPERKNVRNLAGVQGITIEKVIAAGVYRLMPEKTEGF